MAKINHINYLDVVDNVFSTARKKGIMHINSEEGSALDNRPSYWKQGIRNI